MPNTASASVVPWTWAMPQSSRAIAVSLISCSQRTASPAGGAAAVRSRRSGAKAAAGLCIRQCLLGLAPACKHLRGSALDQLVGIPDAEMVAAFGLIELRPADRPPH